MAMVGEDWWGNQKGSTTAASHLRQEAALLYVQDGQEQARSTKPEPDGFVNPGKGAVLWWVRAAADSEGRCDLNKGRRPIRFNGPRKAIVRTGASLLAKSI